MRRARVAMGWVWSYEERKFKGDVKWRLKLFDSVVKGILLYGVEVWGYTEWKEVESLQEKYLRWILGLERHTPGYIVREEIRRDKVRVESGVRAGRFEEKLERGKGGELGEVCMREKRKNERETRMDEWSKESIKRRNFLWRCGLSEIAMNELGENKWKCVKERDREVDGQERGEKIRASRSCVNYERAWGDGLPKYMRICKRNEGKKMQLIARWRCGNEELGNRYWLTEERKACRICGWERESLDHLVWKCVGIAERREEGMEVKREDGRGYEWMRMIERMRRERGERERVREREKEREREGERDRVR